MNEEIHYITNKRKNKTVMNEWENDDSDILRALYSVHKLGQFFFRAYLLNCLNKDTSVLLKVINI